MPFHRITKRGSQQNQQHCSKQPQLNRLTCHLVPPLLKGGFCVLIELNRPSLRLLQLRLQSKNLLFKCLQPLVSNLKQTLDGSSRLIDFLQKRVGICAGSTGRG